MSNPFFKFASAALVLGTLISAGSLPLQAAPTDAGGAEENPVKLQESEPQQPWLQVRRPAPLPIPGSPQESPRRAE